MTASFGHMPDRPRPTACFSVTAVADPGVMPRVLGEFAKLGLVPSQCHSVLAGSPDKELLIDIQCAGLDGDTAARLAESLRRMVCVRAVLTAEKRELRSA